MCIDLVMEEFFVQPQHFDGAENLHFRHLMIILAASLPACSAVLLREDDGLTRARELNRKLLVLDTHLDTPSRALKLPDWSIDEKSEETLVDLPRMRAAGMNAPFMVVYTSPSLKGHDALTHALALSDVISGWVEDHPRDLSLARSVADVLDAKRAGRISVVMCMENSSPVLEGRLDLVRTFYRLGVRYMSLCHFQNNHLADSSTDEPLHGGVSKFGEQVIAEANSLGIMLDVSHISDDAVRDHLRLSKAPIIASHSNVRKLCDHPRNLSDELILGIAKGGGVIQLNFAAQYVSADYLVKYNERKALIALKEKEIDERLAGQEEKAAAEKEKLSESVPRPPPPPLEDWFEHVDYIARLVGKEYVGLGSDFDGIGAWPGELKDITSIDLVTAGLLKRGWSEKELAGFYSGNLLRVWKKVEEVSGRLER